LSGLSWVKTTYTLFFRDFAKLSDGIKNPRVAESLKEIGITNTYQLLANYMMDKKQIGEFVKGYSVLHDDRPVVEFTAPRLGAKGVVIKGKNLEAMLRYRKPPVLVNASDEDERIANKYFQSQSEFFKGQVENNFGKKGRAAGYYDRALEINADNPDARYAFLKLNLAVINSAVAGERYELAFKMLKDTMTMDTHGWFKPQLHYLNGMLLAKEGRLLEAEVAFKEAIREDEGYFLVLVNLAGLYGTKLNRPEEAEKYYRKALRYNPTTDERNAILSAIEGLKKTGGKYDGTSRSRV